MGRGLVAAMRLRVYILLQSFVSILLNHVLNFLLIGEPFWFFCEVVLQPSCSN